MSFHLTWPCVLSILVKTMKISSTKFDKISVYFLCERIRLVPTFLFLQRLGLLPELTGTTGDCIFNLQCSIRFPNPYSEKRQTDLRTNQTNVRPKQPHSNAQKDVQIQWSEISKLQQSAHLRATRFNN